MSEKLALQTVNCDRISGCEEENCGEHSKMCVCCVRKSSAINRRIIGHWTHVKTSENGEMEWHYFLCSGCPVIATSADMLRNANVIVSTDRQMSVNI